ncbi:putative RNA-directed DNA polymerase from transposon X-element [Araneus ventricosus]|uniref:Putative RNA-directed DNA polymerase from transposon X-element n=1 Tax=Araneus ventricosus TaxID=182803 RepID=A0A4Y2V313_ARAVE|nr:putative RNA-directed DNA polymerase from transposon X-element [Araneus ventricosus]
MATQNETFANSEGVSADPLHFLHFALKVCNGIDISKCTGPEECDIYVCKIDACLDTLEKVSPQSVELSNAIHMLDRSLNRILQRKISILATLLSNQIIANAYTNSHVNNIFSDLGSDSESSSTSNTFHKKSKKNRRSPQKEENASKKSKKSFEYQINTSNRFANLENEQDHYENQSNQDDEMKDIDNQQGLFSHTAKTPSEINLRSFQSSQPGPATANNSNNANKSRYVPPIYIDNPKNVPHLLDLLSEITKEKITGRMMNNDKLKIFPPTPEAHKAIQNKITQDGMKSHTYDNDEKQIKVVIRGLSKDFDTSVIISHLQNQGFAPTLCHPIRNRQSTTNFNLFLVTLPKIPKSKEIYQIEFIGRMRVTIESLRKKQSPGQCYNCQEFFHHSRLCTRNPKCIKCAGPHRSRECPKPKDTPSKCLHCNCPHTANFTGCPKNPINRRTFSVAPENAWADPAIIAKIKMSPTPAVEPNPNPATQFIPRPVQLASNANPQPKNWNAAGIKNKINQLKYVLLDWKPDILALQKTHLNPGDRLKFPNYSSYRTDRLTHRGGGTAILIRNSIDHHPIPIASTTFENTTIELHLPDSTPITISSIYRPPHGSISTLELNNIFNSNSKCITVGDFKAKHRAWSSGTWNSNGTIIHDYICNNNLILLAPCEPTHFPNHSNNPSTLDFGILKNFSSGDANSINALSSDHNPVYFEIDINVNLPAISKIIKTTNWSKFKQIMSTYLPGNPDIQNVKDIDEAITKLNSAILTAINLASRSKLINGNYRKLPNNIVKKITLRNQIRKRWQQTYDPRYRRTANRLTNKIRREIRDYDQESWKEWLMSLTQEDNSIYIAARKYIQIPPMLDTDGIKYTPLGKANAFKYSLENSFQTNPEPYDDVHIDEVNRAIRRYINNPKPSSNIKFTSPQEILSFLKRINPRKATGPDGIPNKALKQIPTNVITFITKICNKCLLCNYFPTIWKTAHVLMFPKPRQNRKLPGNYRPISLLSNIGKIFEKIILSRLKE